MQIRVVSPSGQMVYSQKINISPVSRIESIANLGSATATGIFISPNTGFSFEKNTASSPNLQGGGYIVDSNNRAIAGIAKSGDIYLLSTSYTLAYASNLTGKNDSYIRLDILGPDQKIAASILYKIDAEYLIK